MYISIIIKFSCDLLQQFNSKSVNFNKETRTRKTVRQETGCLST